MNKNETYKPIETEEHLDYYFYRPLADYIVKLTLHTSVTPNQLTLISFLLGVASGWLFYYSETYLIILGILILMLSNIFDCSDGQLARARKSGSMSGRVLDGIADNLVFLSIYLAGVFKFQDQSILLLDGYPPYGWIIWVVALIAGVGHSLQSSFFDYYRNEYIAFVVKGYQSESTTTKTIQKEMDSIKGVKGKQLDRFILSIYYVYTKIQEKANKENKLTDRYQITKDFASLYREKNLSLLKWWSLLGATNHITYIMIFMIFDRLDLYFIFEAVILNIYMIVLKMIQNRKTKEMESQLNLK